VKSLADLRFIAERVLADIRANPPTGPLLGEAPAGSRKRDVCRRGHVGAPKRSNGGCVECYRAGRRARP